MTRSCFTLLFVAFAALGCTADQEDEAADDSGQAATIIRQLPAKNATDFVPGRLVVDQTLWLPNDRNHRGAALPSAGATIWRAEDGECTFLRLHVPEAAEGVEITPGSTFKIIDGETVARTYWQTDHYEGEARFRFELRETSGDTSAEFLMLCRAAVPPSGERAKAWLTASLCRWAAGETDGEPSARLAPAPDRQALRACATE